MAENGPRSDTSTHGTLTVRLIKSFEYRTFKNVVLHNIDFANLTVGDIRARVDKEIQTGSGMKPFRNVAFDTLKIYTQAHGAKTNNLIINLDHDDWFLSNDHDILDYRGIGHETEISYFNREAYERFKLNPEVKW
ncbi:hypothetical protein IWQ62_004233 [Dispira parvispora]|uniref:Uncharacterized protein n=1 Tax=Dispira parvispora TaxID=1520584 RepID=A0A9W8AQ84_9FUNG|nr:hypothetical protein IWQ62_004233 [Dispira parvispora]